MTELAREVLEGAELADLQSLFADEMQVSSLPLGHPMEESQVLVQVTPKSWEEWALEHQEAKVYARKKRVSRRGVSVPSGQLSIWPKE